MLQHCSSVTLQLQQRGRLSACICLSLRARVCVCVFLGFAPAVIHALFILPDALTLAKTLHICVRAYVCVTASLSARTVDVRRIVSLLLTVAAGSKHATQSARYCSAQHGS